MSGDLTNQEKLEDVYELTVENNKMLRSMRKQQHIANAFRFVYWLIILGVLGGAYYYVSPDVKTLSGSGLKMEDTLNQFNDLRSQLPETKLFDKLLQSLKTYSGVSTTTE